MILKAIWIAIVFIATLGAVFIASFGVKIQEAYYEKTDIIVAEDERRT